MDGAGERRASPTRALEAADVAMDYYELAADEVTFETERGELTAGVDEAVRFAPGE